MVFHIKLITTTLQEMIELSVLMDPKFIFIGDFPKNIKNFKVLPWLKGIGNWLPFLRKEIIRKLFTYFGILLLGKVILLGTFF